MLIFFTVLFLSGSLLTHEIKLLLTPWVFNGKINLRTLELTPESRGSRKSHEKYFESLWSTKTVTNVNCIDEFNLQIMQPPDLDLIFTNSRSFNFYEVNRNSTRFLLVFINSYKLLFNKFLKITRTTND